jgi:hypothetical protein
MKPFRGFDANPLKPLAGSGEVNNTPNWREKDKTGDGRCSISML